MPITKEAIIKAHSDDDVIYIFENHAIIRTLYRCKYVTNDNTTIVHINGYISHTPGFLFTSRIGLLENHKEPPSKKWKAEYRIAKFISDDDYDGKRRIHISDTIVKHHLHGCPSHYFTNDEIYSLSFNNTMDKRSMSVFSHNIVGKVFNTASTNTYKKESYTYILSVKITKSHKQDDIYHIIINCRARGFIKLSMQMSDIIVINDH
jgi:hypothetical protein